MELGNALDVREGDVQPAGRGAAGGGEVMLLPLPVAIPPLVCAARGQAGRGGRVGKPTRRICSMNASEVLLPAAVVTGAVVPVLFAVSTDGMGIAELEEPREDALF